MQTHTWLSTGTSPSSQGPILPRLPWFWQLHAAQLHAAQHHARECTCTHAFEDPACSTHRELYSLTHRRHQHCQSTSSRPATEPCNTRLQPCITIVLAFNPAHPSSDIHHAHHCSTTPTSSTPSHNSTVTSTDESTAIVVTGGGVL